ncbi:MAG: M4 family metallopeptidase, partial [Dinghuibacter sp.]|nr:M4 family metallopeptidase [Dinghuibacter sp.]
MKRILSLLCVLAGIYTTSFAQEMQAGRQGMWPNAINYKNAAPVYSANGIKMINPSGVSVTLFNGNRVQSETDRIGQTHHRYQQIHQGIKVENAVLLVHVQNNKIQSQNGRWVKDFPSALPTTPLVNATQAVEKAMQYSGARTFKWQMPEEEAFLKREQQNPNATFYPRAELVYYCGEQDINPAALKLAYKLDVYAHDPVGRSYIFVDAVTGALLGKRELIHEADANGTAVTGYSGTQTITADNTGAGFRLRETGRGNGINTYNLQKTTNYAAAVDFTDADNVWDNANANLDQYATDAHWGTEKTYDYFLLKHGRNSIDNAGMALNSYVHYGNSYFNAFWDGSRMTYGDGDAAHGNKPLTSLDVCGHEITHGITERTSALIYSYESGAMNEAFSDIFGTAIEAFARPGNTDWLIGGDFFTIRSMSNPNAFNHPDTYQGTYWYSGSGDNGGVHYNSGVLNFWFYLLVNGGSGTNDHGTPYNVTGIGMDKAAAIAYRLNTIYLTPTSEYYDARTFGIQAAQDLFPGGDEVTQTMNAFAAVGLYAPSCGTVTGLSASNVADHTATISWNSMPGATTYSVQYKPNGASSWFSAGTVTDTFINFSYLNHSTLYDWRVRPSCNGNYSYAQFTTLAPICAVPGTLSSIVVDTTATLSWNPTNYGTSFTI